MKLTGAWVYATGRAYTKVLGRYALLDDPFGASEFNNAFTVGKVNASRLPLITVWIFQRNELAPSLEYNPTSASNYKQPCRNVWFQNFDFDENPVEQTDVTLLPIIPAISITFNYPK